MTLTEKLNILMGEKGLNQRQLSLQTGIPYSTISNWYKDSEKAANAKLGALRKISNYFSVSLDYLSDDAIDNRNYGKRKDPIVSDMPNIIPITGMAPIYGSIPAGVPVFAEQNIEGYMPIMLRNPQEYFCLRVNGDSMINAHITSGSVVIIHHQNTAENGEIVACRVNGDEATLKRFKQMDDTVFLMPENSAYEPIIVSCKDFEEGYAEILGIVKQIVLEAK